MKCPHCNTSVSIFSKEMNRFGKSKLCPHCGKSIKLAVGLVPAALWFVPAVAVSMALSRWLGDGASPVAIVLLLLLSFRLRPVV
jgi:hypothetical protein